MKKLAACVLPVVLALAACGDQRARERIGPSRSGDRTQKAVTNLYSEDALIKVAKELAEKKQNSSKDIRAIAEREFKPLLVLGQPAKTTPLKKDKKGNTIDEEENAPLVQKAQNNIWKDIKIIEVNPIRNEGDTETTGLSIRLKIGSENRNLEGPFSSAGKVGTLRVSDETIITTPDLTNEKTVAIEAKSICITADCKQILSLVRLDDANYRVIASIRQSVKKSGKISGKALKSSFVDIHHVVGSQQEQMAIYLKYADDSSATLISELAVQNVMEIQNAEFRDRLKVTKVTVGQIDDGSPAILISNNESTDDDDLELVFEDTLQE